MIRIGLTGSIGMGKSAVSSLFSEAGIPVYDSDAVVHSLYNGPAAKLIEAAFPGTLSNGAVNRAALGARVFADQSELLRLEAIVHPMVSEARLGFVCRAKAAGKDTVAFDIPLLFETRMETSADIIVVVSAPENIQKARVLQRSGMTLERFAHIKGKQIEDFKKRQLAHFVIDTSRSVEFARLQVGDFLRAVASMSYRRSAAHA